MHILSIKDIQLIVHLVETGEVLSDIKDREKQVDSLVRMGYLRPLRGVFALTELGEKTANSLQMRHFVPAMMVTGAALEAGQAPALETA